MPLGECRCSMRLLDIGGMGIGPALGGLKSMIRGCSSVASWLVVMLVFGFGQPGSVMLTSAKVLKEPADWNDQNIVLLEGRWAQVDPNPEPGLAPPPPRDDRWKRNDSTIVVLIAAFRETRCPETLRSLFTEAKHPERVFAGVVQQNAPIDKDCLYEFCALMAEPSSSKSALKTKSKTTNGAENPNSNEQGSRYGPHNCPHWSQVRMIRMTHKEAKGPVYARAIQATLVVDEDDFCMQIDAHTKFIKHWDTRTLDQWGMANNEYAVLTTYPTNVHDLYKNSNNHWEMPHLCHASTQGAGVVVNGRASAVANLERPILAPLWAAGLSFSRCHAERNVPNDINLKSIFAGEEYGRGARLWTHGYDFYSVSRPIIGTFYGSEKKGGGQGNRNNQEFRESRARLATLLKWPGSDQSEEAISKLGTYGLGTRRSLEEYATWSGINTITGKVEKHCIVDYVPWKSKRSEYNEYQPAGIEVVKNEAWRASLIKQHDTISGTYKGIVGKIEQDKELFVNLVVFVVIVLIVLGVLVVYTSTSFKKGLKSVIPKYSS